MDSDAKSIIGIILAIAFGIAILIMGFTASDYILENGKIKIYSDQKILIIKPGNYILNGTLTKLEEH